MTPDEVRKKLTENLPDYIGKLDEIIRKPGRNAQTQLAGIKVVLDRLVPAVTATTISAPAGGPIQVTLRLIEAKKDDPSPRD